MKGRFSKDEDAYIRRNHRTTTDAEMASALNRTENSVCSRRRRLGLKGNRRKPLSKRYPGQSEDEAARRFWEAECRKSPNFRGILRSLDKDEELAYIEMWTEWHSEGFDFTAMERDLIHYSILAQVRVHRLMQEQKESRKRTLAEWRKGNLGATLVSRSKEIREQQGIILKNHESLNVQRRQRLKDRQEAGSRFIELIKEHKQPGSEAPILKCLKRTRKPL